MKFESRIDIFVTVVSAKLIFAYLVNGLNIPILKLNGQRHWLFNIGSWEAQNSEIVLRQREGLDTHRIT